MIKVSIQQSQTLFGEQFETSWSNPFLPRQMSRGFFTSPNLQACAQSILSLSKNHADLIITSIIKERRWVYQNYWRPQTMSECNIQRKYIETLNTIERKISKLKQKSFKEVQGIILNLCADELRTIIPGQGKTKHEEIKQKVDALRDFFAIKAAKICASSDKIISKIEF